MSDVKRFRVQGVVALVALALTILFPTSATADDADPIAVRRWLCTFFTAGPSEWRDLVLTAPLTFAPRSELVHRRREQERYFSENWTLGSQTSSSSWFVDYRYATRRDNSRQFGFNLKIDGPYGAVMLPDEESVFSFFENFSYAGFNDEAGEYHFSNIGAGDPDVAGNFDFDIRFQMRGQTLEIHWFGPREARNGREFCQSL